MKIIISIILAASIIFLAGCGALKSEHADIRNQCAQSGYKQGTGDFDKCVRRLDREAIGGWKRMGKDLWKPLLGKAGSLFDLLFKVR